MSKISLWEISLWSWWVLFRQSPPCRTCHSQLACRRQPEKKKHRHRGPHNDCSHFKTSGTTCPHICRQNEPGKALKLALNPECFLSSVGSQSGEHVQLNHMWRSESIQREMNAARQNQLPSSINANIDTLAENGVSRDWRRRYTPRSHLGITYGSFCHSTTAWWRIRSNRRTTRDEK